jgi:ribose transport system permease protein
VTSTLDGRRKATSGAPEPAPRWPGGGNGVLRLAERYALVGLVAAIAVFFSVLPASAGTFATVANLRFLSANQSITILLALAVLLPLVAGHFDFSAGAVAATSSVITAGLMEHQRAGLWLCVIAGICTGSAAGLLNGLAISRLRVNSFISTLATATLLGGFIQWYTGGQAISNNISATLVDFGSGTWGGLPRPVWVAAVSLLAVWYLLTHTPFGRSLQAIGDNSRAATLVGIPTGPYTLRAFAASGTLAGVAGVVLTARTGGATANNGMDLLFPALAAVFLGATAIQPGRFNVWGTLAGVTLVAVSVSGLTLAGTSDWVSPVFNGAALAIAVILSGFLRRRAGGIPA